MIMGRNWKSSSGVPNPEGIAYQEPGVVELKNSDIFMFMRTDEGVQYVTYSKDKGETWSPVAPGNIVSPRSPASIERIPQTGDLLLVWNNNGIDQRRSPLNIAISNDEGKSWSHVKTLEDEPSGRYCYTAIHFLDKDVFLGYSSGSSTVKGRGWASLDILKLSLDWIYK
jgi:sialidase-1